MPSSEECHEAAAHVRKWYREWLESNGFDTKEVEIIMNHIPYSDMRTLFLEKTGTYSGPYSPY